MSTGMSDIVIKYIEIELVEWNYWDVLYWQFYNIILYFIVLYCIGEHESFSITEVQAWAWK